MLHHQFEAVAGYNNWAPQEKVMHLLTVLNEQATNVLHSIPAEVMYEELTETLEGTTGTTNWPWHTIPS
jgi:hypothetical protein